MPTITRDQVRVPADVMPEARENYIENYMKATRGTGRLMLFACDQKIEHLNKDFYGEGIDPSDLEPEHLFEIGSKGTIGILAGQRGLIAQYANDYPEINYLVKMNSKTNLVKGAQDDPYSPQLYDLEAVLAMKNAVVIPHLGASTPESEENCARMAAQELREYLENGQIRNSVNLPEILLGRSEGIRIQIIHGNEPGMVSAISAAIGARKININNMVNKSRKDVAVTVLEVEKAPDARLLTELMALPNVIRVRTF